MEDRYIIRKYNEREYALYDTEQNKYVQKGSLAEMQGMLQYVNNAKFKDMIKSFNDGEETAIDNTDNTEPVKESYKGFASRLTESGVDEAVQALQKYIKDDGTFDSKWFNDCIQMEITNTNSLYDEMVNTRHKNHSIAYNGMLQVLSNDGHSLTSRQYQSAFNKLGLDYKEILKPTVDWVENYRKELKEESNDEQLTESTDTNAKIKDLANEVFNWYDEDMGNHFDEIQGNETDIYNHILSSLENKDYKEITKYIEDMWEDDSMSVVVKQLQDLIHKDKIDEEMFSASDKVKQDSKDKGLYTESDEEEIPLVNEDDELTYDNLYIIGIDMGVQGQVKLYKVYADYEEQAIDIVVSYIEQNNLPGLINCSDVDPIDAENYVYIDATEYGASQPYYILNTCIIQEANDNKIAESVQKNTDSENINNIIDQLKRCGIKKETTLTRMSQDVLKVLKTYNADTKQDEIYLQPAIMNAIQDVIEKITGKRPQLTLESKLQEEEKTVLDYLQDRVGQKMDVGELNSLLQSLFGKYNDIFITFDTVINATNWDEPQELYVVDDDDTYTIIYNILDVEQGIVEITDVIME